MSKLTIACGLALVLMGAYASEALAVTVTRDPGVSGRTAVPRPRAAATAATPAPKLPQMTAEQIVQRNVAARGGAAAWRAVQTMTVTGKLDAGGKKDTMLPYTLQVKRPNKQRLAIEFGGHTGVQTFDGQHGWKLRPWFNRPDAEPYSPDELKKAMMEPPIDGLLVDYAAKGSKVELAGTEMVEKSPCYRLKVTSKQGHVQHVWVDGKTFLEAKIEGNPHRFDGTMRKTETYFSDYKRVDKLMIPFVAETRVEHVPGGHALMIDKVVLNSKLADNLFEKPASLTAAEMPPMPRMVKVAPTPVSAAPTTRSP